MAYRKLIWLLAFLTLAFSFVPHVSALPLSGGGGFKWGGQHHFIDIICDWPLGGGDWTPDVSARTVTQTVATMACHGTNLDPDGNGKIDTPSANAGSGLFSLTLTFTIPANASGQLSKISCNNDVRTYTAYCEQALFNNNGVEGEFTLIGSSVPSFATILGCNATGCTWPLGSLPSKSQGNQIVLDTSQFGCQRAFPTTTVNLGASDVNLATNQLLLYTEAFTNGNGQCTAGTVAPIEHAARACIGEANALSVTDCNQIGSGNQTRYHVAFQQNTSYLFNVSGFESAQPKIQDASSCNNTGTVKFTVFGEDQFDVRSIAGLAPFDPNLAPTVAVIGATSPGEIQATNANLFTDHVELFYSQCGIGNQISSIPGFQTGDRVVIEINGETIPAGLDGGDIQFTAQTSVGTN